jgi:hypothetical protein
MQVIDTTGKIRLLCSVIYFAQFLSSNFLLEIELMYLVTLGCKPQHSHRVARNLFSLMFLTKFL